MPNWVYNHLTVEGDAADLRAFRLANRAPDVSYREDHLPPVLQSKRTSGKPRMRAFSFAGVVPVPPEVQAEPFDPVGYNWQTKHWGTKWDASSVTIQRKAKALVIRFDTPWGPPLPWFRAVVEAWPQLRFHWWAIEEQPAFCLEVTVQGGQTTMQRDWVKRLEDRENPLLPAELDLVFASPFRDELAGELASHAVVLQTRRGREWVRRYLAAAEGWQRTRVHGHLTAGATGRQRARLWREGLAAIQDPQGFGTDSEMMEWLELVLGGALDQADDETVDPSPWLQQVAKLSKTEVRALLRAMLLSPDRTVRMAGTRLAGLWAERSNVTTATSLVSAG